MTLDLDELTSGWECRPGELRARVIVGREGRELVQLRVDLGVMQMFPEGRPDGQRCHGLPSARDYIEHELRVGGGQIEAADWQELERELLQTNYRRLAFSALAEDALQASDQAAAGRYIRGALSDVETCLEGLRLASECGAGDGGDQTLRPTLVFDRARLLVQLHVVEGQFEEAIEQAEAGAVGLDGLLRELGYDQQQREEDPGVQYLRDLGHQLRREYGVTQTLSERLTDALERDDFETAAEIRDEMRRRRLSPLAGDLDAS